MELRFTPPIQEEEVEDQPERSSAPVDEAETLWLERQAQLTEAIRGMADRVRRLEAENLELRAELRRARLRESSLREDRSMMLRDLRHSLETIERVLDLLAVQP